MLNMSLPKKVEKAIATFISNLRKAYPDARAYLFGSFARGDWLEDSDVDIVVISSALKGSLIKRMSKLRCMAPDSPAFQVFAYTPKEWKELLGYSTFWREVTSYWIELPLPSNVRKLSRERVKIGSSQWTP